MFDLIIESLKFLRENGSLKIFAYVILENHLHMIVSSEDLSNTMMRFKSYTARRIIDYADMLMTQHIGFIQVPEII